MQDGLNSVTNLVCSVGYEASTANQRKQLNVFDSRNHLGFLFFLVCILASFFVMSTLQCRKVHFFFPMVIHPALTAWIVNLA